MDSPVFRSLEQLMKMLVATGKTQGRRESDFHWCVEGELVWLGLVCRKDKADPDGGCGCGRAFAGLSSHRATTTARVGFQLGFTRGEYIDAIASSLERQRWDPSVAEEIAEEQLLLVADWPVGTVVERRLDKIRPRSPSWQRRMSC